MREKGVGFKPMGFSLMFGCCVEMENFMKEKGREMGEK